MRREADGIRRYVHVGTGNYNPQTAQIYEDVGLLSADPELGSDVAELFNFLTGYSRQRRFGRLLVAPIRLRSNIIRLIRREAARPAGGRITLKVNSLVDSEIVQLVGALDAESVNGHHLIAHWFLLILLTAQRPGEVAAMRWDQLDIFDDGNDRAKIGWWNVRTSKNKQPIHAALSPEVVRLLRALRIWSRKIKSDGLSSAEGSSNR